MNPTRKVLLSIILGLLILSASAKTLSAQTSTSQYWIKVDPAPLTPIAYGTIGKNWTLPFQTIWSYGETSGEPIENATIILEVRTNDDMFIENITQITDSSGFATFYYTSSTPSILVFIPITVATQNNVEYSNNLFEKEQNNLFGLQANSLTVYWDTFGASLINTNTNKQGATEVLINISYSLIPEDGLFWINASSSEKHSFPKNVHGANVTINGVEAKETSTIGVYEADFSTWSPTTYMFVEISQEEWLDAQLGFSFAHTSNAAIWTPAVLIFGVCIAIMLTGYLFFRKPKESSLPRSSKFPFVGGILLALTSFLSLYWGVVGLESVLLGFDWILLAVSGLFSFVFGLLGSLLSLLKRGQAFVIFVVIFPAATNVVGVMESFKIYGLVIPWLVVFLSLVISFVSGVLICNSDDYFQNKQFSTE